MANLKSDLKTYFVLLKANLQEMFGLTKKQLGFKTQNKEESFSLEQKPDKTGAKRIFGVILSVVAVLVLLFYIAFTVVGIASLYVAGGIEDDFIYGALLIVQIAVLFLGGMATLNNLYFCKDNEMLLNLPVKSSIIFAVKFTLSYLSQLIISAALALPILISYGVSCAVLGGKVFGAAYYILSVLSVFLLPILPLLVISLFIIPIVYFISFFKNRDLGKTIVYASIIVLFMAVYIVMIVILGTLVPDQGESVDFTQITPETINILSGLKKVGIYNYSFASAMAGKKVLLNFIVYIAGLVAIFAVVLLISGLFYRKGISIATESGSSGKKKVRSEIGKIERKQVTPFKALIIKELRCLLKNPQFYLITVIFAVLIPVYCFMMKSGTLFEGEDMPMASAEVIQFGILSFMSLIFATASTFNMSVAFSLEGKNINILKTLPVLPRTILKSKLAVVMLPPAILAVVAAISYVAIDSAHNVLLGLFMLIMLCGAGSFSAICGLYYDIKKPNFRFINANELTHNNTRVLKPMLITMGLAFVAMASTFICSVIAEASGKAVAYVVFFSVMLLTYGVAIFIGGKKLFDSIDMLFERTEP